MKALCEWFVLIYQKAIIAISNSGLLRLFGAFLTIAGIITLLAKGYQIATKEIKSHELATIAKTKFTPLFAKTDTSFNVIVLELDTLEDCDNITAKYESEIVGAFSKLNKKEKSLVHIDAKFNSDIKCSNYQEAIHCLKTQNADMVIWGDYDELCNNDKKRIRLYFTTRNVGNYDFSQVFQAEEKEITYVIELSDNIDKQVIGVILIASALKYEKEDNPLKALDCYNQLVNGDNDRTVLFHKMNCYRRLKRYQEALESINKLAKANMPLSLVELFKFRLYRNSDTTAARKALNLSFKYAKEENTIRDNVLGLSLIKERATFLHQVGDFQNCVFDCEYVLTKSTNDTAIMKIAAFANASLKRMSEALFWANKYLEYNLNDCDMRFLRGTILMLSMDDMGIGDLHFFNTNCFPSDTLEYLNKDLLKLHATAKKMVRLKSKDIPSIKYQKKS